MSMWPPNWSVSRRRFQKDWTCSANGGRLLEIGNISLMHGNFETDPAFMVLFNKSIIAVGLYGRDTLKKALDFLVRTKNKYPYEKILSQSYKLEDINKAFEDQEKGLVSRSAIVM